MTNVLRVDSPTNEAPNEDGVEVNCPSLNITNDRIVEAFKILDDRDWANIEEFLIPWSSQRITLVHIAAYAGNLEVLKRADALHANLSARDYFGRCALHCAADQGRVDVLRWLLNRLALDEEHNEAGPSSRPQLPLLRSAEDDQLPKMGRNDFDIQDRNGRTPLHAAVYGGHLECIRILLREGFSLASETNNRITVVDAIFGEIAHPIAFLTEILDEQVSAADDAGNQVILDFGMLTAPPSVRSHEQMIENISDLNVVLALIDAVPNMEGMAILEHPLLATFLHLKYVVAIPLNLIVLFFHIVFVSSISWHAICIKSKNETCMKWTVAIPPIASLGFIFLDSLWTLSGRAGLYLHFQRNQISMYMPMFPAMMNFFFSVSLIQATIKCPSFPCDYPSDLPHMIAVMILLSWSNMMLVLGRFPLLGEYAFMFFTVLFNVGKVLLIFASLILGFAFSFFVLFPGNDQFSTAWKALAKTLVMMTGEYDYDALFPPTEDNNSTIGNSTSSGSNAISLPVTSTVVLLVFVMVTSIGLMNLMVGLAVSDIHELLKEGRIRRLMKQADSAFHWIGPGYVMSWALGYPPEHLTKMRSRTTTLDLRSSSRIPWRGIPADIRNSLYKLAMKNSRRNKKPQTDSSNSENKKYDLAAVRASLQRILIEQQAQNSQIKQLTMNLNIKRCRKSL